LPFRGRRRLTPSGVAPRNELSFPSGLRELDRIRIILTFVSGRSLSPGPILRLSITVARNFLSTAAGLSAPREKMRRGSSPMAPLAGPIGFQRFLRAVSGESGSKCPELGTTQPSAWKRTDAPCDPSEACRIESHDAARCACGMPRNCIAHRIS
jgi:hypothetical protein